jgi:hypothetical protein
VLAKVVLAEAKPDKSSTKQLLVKLQEPESSEVYSPSILADF